MSAMRTDPIARMLALLCIASACATSGCATTGSGSEPAEESAERERRDQLAAQAWLQESVILRAPGGTLEHTRAEFGLRIDGLREGEVRPQAVNGAPVPMRVDRTTVGAYVREMELLVVQEAAPGSVDIETRTVTRHRVARTMDVDAAEIAFVEGLLRGEPVIDLPVVETPPETGIVPEGLLLTSVVGEYTTRFRQWGSYRGRGRNVRTAGEKLNGAIIGPGETLSFNERVGPRTYREGFRRAPVIVRGEIVEDWGGGVCQVSSTLHGAAFFGGLDMVEHQVHSRPSNYIPVGLDATVAWPDLDFVLRNPFEFPIYVHVLVDRNEFTVQLLGAETRRTVEYERSIGEWRGHGEREIDDPERPYGVEEVTERGIAGRTIYRTRTLREGAREWVERDEVVYPPTDRITRIGTGPPEEPELVEAVGAVVGAGAGVIP